MATLFNKMDFIGFIAADHFHTRANSLFIITDGIMVITLSLLSPTISLTLHRRLMDKPVRKKGKRNDNLPTAR